MHVGYRASGYTDCSWDTKPCADGDNHFAYADALTNRLGIAFTHRYLGISTAVVRVASLPATLRVPVVFKDRL